MYIAGSLFKYNFLKIVLRARRSSHPFLDFLNISKYTQAKILKYTRKLTLSLALCVCECVCVCGNNIYLTLGRVWTGLGREEKSRDIF